MPDMRPPGGPDTTPGARARGGSTAESLNEDLRDLLEVVRTADLSRIDLDAATAKVRALTAAIRPHVVDAVRMQAFLQGDETVGQGDSPARFATTSSRHGEETEDETVGERDSPAGADPSSVPDPVKGLARMPPASISGMHGGESAEMMPYSPYTGTLNPISPPVALRVVASGNGYVTAGSVCFRDTFNGPPGCVHGGVIAAVLDEVLGMTCLANDRGGFTGTLTVRYRSPTVLGRTVAIRSWMDRVEGRKTFVRGTLRDGDTLLAEAEGIFISA